MSGYKLADGSLSSIYKVGDEFEVVGRNIGLKVSIGDVVKFYRDDKTDSPWFHDGSWCCAWVSLKPTPETKRKAHYRETGKWLVLEGDYVVHSDMTFKQFKEWCDAAKACGFSLDHVNPNVCVITFADDEGDLVSSWYTDIGAKTNTTEEFLEFLAKEEKGVSKFMENVPNDATHYGKTSKGDICFYKLEGDTWYFLYANAAEKGGNWCRVVDNKPSHTPLTEIEKREIGWFWAGYSYPSHTPLTEIKRQFTKADLKDGMRCIDREGHVWYVCGYSIVKPATGAIKPFIDWCNDLTGRFYNSLGIMKVVDRDGTILFEREEEPTELTLEEIAEKFGLPVDRVRIKK